jgi:hypothetical protein
MSSYVVSERIGRASPHLGPGVAPRPLEESDSGAGDSSLDVEVVDDAGEDGLDAWFERLSTVWSQTTWYVFNPEGWR